MLVEQMGDLGFQGRAGICEWHLPGHRTSEMLRSCGSKAFSPSSHILPNFEGQLLPIKGLPALCSGHTYSLAHTYPAFLRTQVSEVQSQRFTVFSLHLPVLPTVSCAVLWAVEMPGLGV